MPIIIAPITARLIRPAPNIIPSPIAQKRYAMSIGSFTALLKRTIDSAPTIPSDNTTFEVTPIIINLT